jgi:antitoxin ParD1/3/4
MNIALTKYFDDLINRMVQSGRYNNASEVVRAALRKLDEENEGHLLPPGSLKHLYSEAANAAERKTTKASSMKVEAE